MHLVLDSSTNILVTVSISTVPDGGFHRKSKRATGLYCMNVGTNLCNSTGFKPMLKVEPL